MAEDNGNMGIGNQDVRNFGFHLLKSENELFDEEKNIKHNLYRVRYKQFKNKDPEWHIFDQEEIVFIIASDKLSKAENKFLCSVDGMKFLLNFSKNGIFNISQLKKAIKNK